jgi:hypothetical protein
VIETGAALFFAAPFADGDGDDRSDDGPRDMDSRFSSVIFFGVGNSPPHITGSVLAAGGTASRGGFDTSVLIFMLGLESREIS